MTSPSALRRARSWGPALRTPSGNAYIVGRSSLEGLEPWSRSGNGARHDHRYFEIVDETIRQNFEYSYLILEDPDGTLLGVQPFFTYPQNLLDGVAGPLHPLVSRLRRAAPKLATLRILM